MFKDENYESTNPQSRKKEKTLDWTPKRARHREFNSICLKSTVDFHIESPAALYFLCNAQMAMIGNDVM